MNKAISPLDGRYGARLAELGDYFSEYALMRARVQVELRFLLALNKTKLFPAFSKEELASIDNAFNTYNDDDYLAIKEIEKKLNHDVKACEVFLQSKLSLSDNNLIHFGLTSEDVNNLSYSFLLKEYVEQVQLPQLEKMLKLLLQKISKWKSNPFPARTHGQMASPTTAGKELAVYASRLFRQYKRLKEFKFTGKLNGATGNYSALLSAFPNYDWLSFSKSFMTENGLEANLITTQIEDHDNWAEYFSICKQINSIVLDMDRDMWLYLTLGYFTLETDAGAVGSSTMPHKVNPINFENSEGNLQLAISLLNGLSDKLGNSRLQRDLSDSTASRNIGVALGHGYLAIEETYKGLSRLQLNSEYCIHELNSHPELLAEPVQTVLRKEGIDDPYNLLKSITRGKRISLEEMQEFVKGLNISEESKERLVNIRVQDYIGDAVKICELALAEIIV
jgi:adenylosuccinate lyase